MATKEQIFLICEITRISAQISIQGKFHAISQYSGHVDGLNVYLYHAIGGRRGLEVLGWSSIDHYVYLGNHSIGDGSEILGSFLNGLYEFLEVDDDGVPL